MPLVETSSGIQPKSGKMKLIWSYCILALNISMKTDKPKDGQVGVQKEGGNWTGLIGMLQRNVVHIGFGSVVQTTSRFTVTRFSNIIGAGQRFFLVGREPPIDSRAFPIRFDFLDTMGRMLYISIISSVILITLVSWSINRERPRTRPKRLFDHFWLAWEIFMGKSSAFIPINSAGRCLFHGWILGSLVIMTGYSGVLVSKFSVKPIQKFISTLSDFTKFPQVYPVVTKGKVDVQILKESKREVLKELWRRIEKKPKWCIRTEDEIFKSSFTVEFRRALEGGRAAFGSVDSNFMLLLSKKQSGPCTFRKTRPYAKSYNSLLLNPNLPNVLVNTINLRISRLSGVNFLIRAGAGSKKNDFYQRCFDEKADDQLRRLTLDQYLGVFAIWLLGLLVASFCICAECLRHYVGFNDKKYTF